RVPARAALFPYTTLFRSKCLMLVTQGERNQGNGRNNSNHGQARFPIEMSDKGATGRRKHGESNAKSNGDPEQGAYFLRSNAALRSEEHTSELQSRSDLVC